MLGEFRSNLRAIADRVLAGDPARNGGRSISRAREEAERRWEGEIVTGEGEGLDTTQTPEREGAGGRREEQTQWQGRRHGEDEVRGLGRLRGGRTLVLRPLTESDALASLAATTMKTVSEPEENG